MELVIGLIGGAIISWFLTHWYFRKANKEVPQWARPLIERFPITPPTVEELIGLYHQAVMDGEIVPHPSGFIKCPDCGADSDKFEPWQVANHRTDTLHHGYRCTECNCELTHDED